MLEGYNQYPPMPGISELARSGRPDTMRVFKVWIINWREEITVTSGATEALACAFLSLIEPGDEVVVFAPTYDAYLPMIRRSGGVPRVVRLAPPDWRFDRAMLEAAFSERTRAGGAEQPPQPHRQCLRAGQDLTLLAEYLRALRLRGRLR